MYDTANHEIYASAWQRIAVIDTSTNAIVANINGVSGSNLAYDSNKGYVYASDDYGNTLAVINAATNKVIANVAMCPWCDPSGMAFYPTGGNIYLANWGKGTVSVISDRTNKITATIAVGSNPFGVFYDSLNHAVYVTGYTSQVYKINPSTNKIVTSFSAGSGPWNIALDTASNELFVTNLGSTTVTVVSP
jgi:YVTN family beta-propeller protein